MSELILCLPPSWSLTPWAGSVACELNCSGLCPQNMETAIAKLQHPRSKSLRKIATGDWLFSSWSLKMHPHQIQFAPEQIFKRIHLGDIWRQSTENPLEIHQQWNQPCQVCRWLIAADASQGEIARPRLTKCLAKVPWVALVDGRRGCESCCGARRNTCHWHWLTWAITA